METKIGKNWGIETVAYFLRQKKKLNQKITYINVSTYCISDKPEKSVY